MDKEFLKKDYDAIVVGSGPGGATVAKELTQKNKKILILEWGNNKTVTGSPLQALNDMAIPGKGMFFTNKRMTGLVRGITTGGSSLYYCGTAFDPPFKMFETYGIDIKDEIDEIKKELPIAPLSDELVGPMAVQIANSANELGYNWNKLNKYIFQDKCKTNCQLCALGCPYEAKWNARNWVETAVSQGATLINGAKVTKVLLEGKTATGVEFKKKRKTYQVEAPTIVMAAGGIGSAVILRHSGLDGAGYDFFMDPLYLVMGSAKGLKRAREVQMVYGMHLEDQCLLTDMSVPDNPNLTIMVKIKDDLGGRITWKGKTRKEISQEDQRKLNYGRKQAKKILKNAGVKRSFSLNTIAAHPGGTVKIGELVDENLKTEYENLYVCDASVIPEAWGLPPSLTILGLGKRLAKHILAGGVEEETHQDMEPNLKAVG